MRGFGRERDRFLELMQSFLLLEQIGHIDASADVSAKISARTKVRHAGVRDKPIFAIVPPQSVSHVKGLPRRKSIGNGGETKFRVIGMNVFHPAIAKILFQFSTGKIAPRFVNKRA